MQKKNNNNNKTMTCSHLWGFDLVSRTLYFPLICIVFFWATRSSLSHRKYFPFHHFKSSHVCWELDSYKILHEWCRARGRSAASQKSLEIFPCKQKKKKRSENPCPTSNNGCSRGKPVVTLMKAACSISTQDAGMPAKQNDRKSMAILSLIHNPWGEAMRLLHITEVTPCV